MQVSWLFCGWGPGYGSYVSERKSGAGIPQSPLTSLPPPFDRLAAEDATVLIQRAVPVEFSAGSGLPGTWSWLMGGRGG